MRTIVTMILFSLALLAAPGIAAAQEEYRLDAGDRVKITVFGEADLSGEFDVDGTGTLSYPLVGTIPSTGLSARELEAEISRRLLDGYLRNPRVAVEVLTYRPYFIVGEVNSPGSYSFSSGLTVLAAVAEAGGFTFRADEDDIEIQRGGADKPSVEATLDTPLMPGDIVRVKERYW